MTSNRQQIALTGKRQFIEAHTFVDIFVENFPFIFK